MRMFLILIVAITVNVLTFLGVSYVADMVISVSTEVRPLDIVAKYFWSSFLSIIAGVAAGVIAEQMTSR